MAPSDHSESFNIEDLASLPSPERMIFDDFEAPPSLDLDGLEQPAEVDAHTSIDELQVKQKLGLRERWKAFERRLINRDEQPSSEPEPVQQQTGVRDKPKAQAKIQGNTPGVGVAPDPRLARLLTPLSPSELRQMQTDVRRAELFFDTVDRVKRGNELIRGVSLVIALATMIAFFWLYGQDYLVRLAEAPVPGWFSAPGLTAEYQAYGVYIAGCFLPIIMCYLLAEALASVMRLIRYRAFSALLPGLVSAGTLLYSWVLFARLDVLQGLIVAVIGTVALSLVLNSLNRPLVGKKRRRR